MTSAKIQKIEPLDQSHDRAAFSCGCGALDDYLKRRARQDQRRNLSQVWVAIGRESNAILGFYTLSNFSIDIGELPPDLQRKLPKYRALPAALIGRMAVGEDLQGRGAVGPYLLVDAIKNVLRAAETVGIYALVVEAKSDRSARFYKRHGFIEFPSQPRKLFMTLETLKQLDL